MGGCWQHKDGVGIVFLGQLVHCRNVFSVCVYALIVLIGLIGGTDSVSARSRADAMLIIDSSISMAGKIKGKSKFSLVRKSLRSTLKSARPRLNLGVIFYGHRRRGDCKDVQHVIRLGRIQPNRYIQIINEKERGPVGRTPITGAIKMAAGILKKRGQANSVILITDGIDICKNDPCKLGKELQRKNSGLKVHVIALRSKASKMTSLRCLARRTGGTYTAANTPGTIKKAVEATFLLASGGTIPIPKISPHRYAKLIKTEEIVNDDTTKEIENSENPAKVAVAKIENTDTPRTEVKTPVVEKTTPPKPSIVPNKPATKPQVITSDKNLDNTASAVFDSFFGPSKKKKGTTNDPSSTENVPKEADTPEVKNIEEIIKPETDKTPPETVTEIIEAKPVETKPSGLSLSARMGTDGAEIENDLFWRIFSDEKIGGKQKEIRQTGAAQPLLDLPPGKYDVTVQFGSVVQRKLVSVEANKTTHFVMTLEAGIIKARAVKVAGGKSLEQDISYTLLGAKKDGADKRTEISRKTASQTRFMVKPGQYQLIGKFGTTTISTDISVLSGKTTVANLVFNTGVLKLSTVAAKGGSVIKGATYIISQTKVNADGQRKQLYKSTKDQSRFTLPAGTYHLKVQHGQASLERTIKIFANKSRVLVLNLNAGYLKLFASPAKAAGILKDKVHYTIYKSDVTLDGKREKITQSSKSAPTFWLPAGNYYVTATYGLASADVEVKITANKRTEKTIIVNAGALHLSSKVEGTSEALKKQVFYVIYNAKADLEGKYREVFSTSQAEKIARIPPGEYLIEGHWGNTNAEVSLSAIVTAGKRTNANIIHQAGRAKFKLTAVPGGAPTGKPYWVFYDNNGTEIGRNVKPTPERIFAEGKYSLVVRHDDQEYRADFSIKSGDEKQIDIVAKQ